MRKYILLLMVLVTAVLFISFKPNKYSKVKIENGEIKLQIKKMRDGRPHYYKHEINGKAIKFFVLMDNESIVRVAFDACDVCYPEGKGYRQEGDFMICNNCGQQFHESKINIIKGGCNPAPVDRIFDQNYVYIAVESLAEGGVYF
jgi:uncharacterized membrane protein